MLLAVYVKPPAVVSGSVVRICEFDSTTVPPSLNDSMFPVMTGASLTAVTVMLAVSMAVLYAVLPPLVLTSTFVPGAPLVWSHARNVTVAVVPSRPLGTNRNRSVSRISRAELSDTLPTAYQLVPLIVYSHMPFPLVSPVMTKPS